MKRSSGDGLHLVTGGAGYFGSLLACRLSEAGYRVRVFDRNPAHHLPDRIERVCGDICDGEAVARACRDVDVIHHNVALVPLAKDRDGFFATNSGGTRNLLEAARAARVRKVVHMSSSAVFGAPPTNPVTCTTPLHPQEDYGRSKLAAEELCSCYQDLDITVIRPRTILGHGRLGIMQILFEWVRSGSPVPVLDRGDNLFQFVHADDLADAVMAAAARPGRAVYNVGAASFCTMRETLEGLIRHAGTRSRVVSVPGWLAVRAMRLTSRLHVSPLGPYHALMYGRSMFFDLTKARSELGYTPRWGNVEMFCQSYDWYVANRARLLASAGTSHHRSPVPEGILRAARWLLSLTAA